MKKTTPSFITEIRLQATPAQESALNKRFEAARQVYNACLGEGLRRLDLMRQSKAWAAARKMPQGDSKSKDKLKKRQAKARSKAFNECWRSFDLPGKFSLQPFAQQFNRCWLGDHLGSQMIKAISSKAYVWVKEYAFDPERGRPRFKAHGRYNSVETGYIGKELLFEKSGEEYIITWTVGRLWDREADKFGRLGPVINLQTIIADDPVTQHGLDCRLKYVRLVRRTLNGKMRFYAQLVNEGKPYQRFKLGQGTIGLNVGPVTVAVVGPSKALIKRLCEDLKDTKAAERRLQRQIDRQRRANNPANYNENGTIKPRPQLKRWQKSNRQRKNETKLSEIRRKQRAHRQSLHGQLINEILRMGDQIKLAKISYKAFQKTFGQSIGERAPGMFIARLVQKMGDLGGLVDQFSTYNAKLAQFDHQTGQHKKKPPSQRWHKFADGRRAQRNLYSAFLATCVEDDAVNQALANERWGHVKPLLDAAVADAKEETEKRPTSFGF
jgi:putative transposase